jgi:SHS family lactate transporter-like MFS transporter
MAGTLIVYNTIYTLFATWMQTDFKLAAAVVATPILLSNLASFAGNCLWGWFADRIGRRWANIIPASIGCIVAPAYLLTNDLTWIVAGFVVQGFFGGTLPALAPSYLTERFPTEVRGTGSGFCYHAGMVIAGFVPLAISYLAIEQNMGFAMPMLIATWAGSATVIVALLFGPETKGKVFVADLMTQEARAP